MHAKKKVLKMSKEKKLERIRMIQARVRISKKQKKEDIAVMEVLQDGLFC